MGISYLYAFASRRGEQRIFLHVPTSGQAHTLYHLFPTRIFLPRPISKSILTLLFSHAGFLRIAHGDSSGRHEMGALAGISGRRCRHARFITRILYI